MSSTQRNLVHLIGLGLLLLSGAYLVMTYGSLPDRVPVHFNAAGEPDGWGDKTTLFVLPAIGFFSWALLWFLRKINPKYINTPVKLTAENRATQTRLGYELLAWMNLIVSAMMAYIVWVTVQATQAPEQTTLGWPFYLLLAGVFGVIVWYVILARKHR